MLRAIPVAVYTCDAQGLVTFCNLAAAKLWGRNPPLNKDHWCGSGKIYRPDGSPLALDDCPMARTVREGKVIRGEVILVERPDGTRSRVLLHPESISIPRVRSWARSTRSSNWTAVNLPCLVHPALLG